MRRLARLGAAIDAAMLEQPFLRVSGVVREVAPTHYRVVGLSSVVKLGDRVSLAVGGRATIGEVVRVDESAATIKPFDDRV
ncbi:MAG: flagellum-specific ATP synthase FliI, partial [Bauldia sp.]